jgi:addiction module HigA family antidote
MANTAFKSERELLSHPGDTILETIEQLRMSQVELAGRLGKTPSKVNDLISSKEPITYNTALQLEKVLGIDAQFWLNREMIYRTKLARIEQAEKMEDDLGWLKTQPVNELKKYGFIISPKKDANMVRETLEFYGVADSSIWEHRYINDYVNTSYRKSNAHKDSLANIAAWLRMGELEMQKMVIPEYDKDRFRKVLEDVKGLVKNHPSDYSKQLRKLCAEAGVAVVYTMSLPKAPVSGATRWFRGNPLIQLTDRHKTNDQFWFSFFHEAGHVVLHGKKELFLEEFEGYKTDADKEEEANRFAEKFLLPANFENLLPGKVTEAEVVEIAEKFKTNPGIVVGRLQRMGLLSWSKGNQFKVKVNLFS